MSSSKTSDPFQELYDKIEADRKIAAGLQLEIPKLEHAKVALKEDIAATTKEYSAVITKVDDKKDELAELQIEIDQKTKKHAQYIKGTTDTLKQAQRNFTDEVATTRIELNDAQKSLDERVSAIQKVEQETKVLHQEAREAVEMHHKANQTLIERENKVEQREKDVKIQETELAEQKTSLDAREVDITAKEKTTAEALVSAESTRKNAESLLMTAREEMARADAKDTENTNKEMILKNFEARLNRRETALKDREMIADSH